jgi:hypothetical protein
VDKLKKFVTSRVCLRRGADCTNEPVKDNRPTVK